MTLMPPKPAAFTSGSMRQEKRAVAGNSVLAALVITTLKIVVGLATGSLGILSEAAHSGLDLIAALVTFFSVRVSDKPADADHQYGHGKFENFSAFIETGLLLLTCIWIISPEPMSTIIAQTTRRSLPAFGSYRTFR
jgi:cation diffusion facilitator family transporter